MEETKPKPKNFNEHGGLNLPPTPIDPNFTPTVSLTRLPATAPLEEIYEVLERDGAVILTELISAEDMALGAKENERELVETASHMGYDKESAYQTKVVNGLVGKSKLAVKLCEHPVLDSIRKDFLTDTWEIEDGSGHVVKHTISPLLSLSQSLNIPTGTPRQRLHRDDGVHAAHGHPVPPKKSSQVTVLLAGMNFNRAHGATVVVPGSHKWEDNRIPELDEVCFAEMDPGSAVVYLGGTYHGGGANTVPDSTRTGYGFFFVRGTVRTEENQYLSVPRSAAKLMSPKMRELLGYSTPTVPLGTYKPDYRVENLPAVLDEVCAS